MTHHHHETKTGTPAPPLKGLMEKTPAYMSFEVTTTNQQDVGYFVNQLPGIDSAERPRLGS